LPGSAEPNRAALAYDFEWPQDPELEQFVPHRTRRDRREDWRARLHPRPVLA
jgi:hypothetical protein